MFKYLYEKSNLSSFAILCWIFCYFQVVVRDPPHSGGAPLCVSQNDPHMTTFDKAYVSNVIFCLILQQSYKQYLPACIMYMVNSKDFI